MARILIGSIPAAGHVNPLLAIARALVGRGHAVRWICGPAFRERIEATGATFIPAVHAPAELSEAAPERQRLRGLAQLKWDLKHGFADAFPGQVRDIEAARRDFPADVVLADSLYIGAALHAERHGTPCAFLGVTPLALNSPETAPFGLGLLPDASPLGRARNAALSWLMRRVLFADVQRYWDQVRAGLGLPPMGRFLLDGVGEGDLYMQATVAEFEYPRSNLPPGLHFIGPVLPEPPQSWQPPAWWGELQSGRPVVHVTQGTVATEAGQLIAPTIRALADEDLLLVVTTGGRPVESIPVERLPANVRVERFIPHAHLLPHVDVMVTNGGYGGVQVALASGVPLVVAGASEDKPEVANRVAYAGVGVNLRTATPSEAQVRRAVRTVLADRGYRERARRLQAIYAAHDAPQIAAGLIERLAEAPRPQGARAAWPGPEQAPMRGQPAS